MRALLGGKGANIAEMARHGPPIGVPSGFTVTTEAASPTWRVAGRSPGPGRVRSTLRWRGSKGGPESASEIPRARCSCWCVPAPQVDAGNDGHGPQPRPRDEAIAGLAERTRSDRFAWDSHRRFVQTFGNVIHGVDGMGFEQTIREAKSARGVSLDTELETDELRLLVTRFKHIYEQ